MARAYSTARRGLNGSKAGTIDELHREKVLTLPFAHLINRHDIRMPQTGGRVRLSPKPIDAFGARITAQEQHLHRYCSAEAQLFGSVDYTHPTVGHLLLEKIITEPESARRAKLGRNA